MTKIQAAALCVFSIVVVCLGAAAPKPATRADVDRWMTEFSNWGRWGKADQIATANLITPAKRRQAASLVKEGAPISLAPATLPVKGLDNDAPFEHKTLYTV